MPAISEGQKKAALKWVSDQLRDVDEAIALAEARHAFVDATVPEKAKDAMRAGKLIVGGSHGGLSMRESPSYSDLDIFWIVPKDTYSDSEAMAIRNIFLMHMRTGELLKVAKERRVPGIDLPVDLKVGWIDGGVSWGFGYRCRHCDKMINNCQATIVSGEVWCGA